MEISVILMPMLFSISQIYNYLHTLLLCICRVRASSVSGTTEIFLNLQLQQQEGSGSEPDHHTDGGQTW